MPQLSYSQNAIVAQPGMAFDLENSDRDVVSRLAAVNIPFGAYCELDANGNAIPMQDSTTGVNFKPLSLGIAMFDPLGVEQQYTVWSVPQVLAGTVAVTNGSLAATFSQNQTLAAGTALTFSSQVGPVYFLAQALNAATNGVLTTAYTGTTNGAATATNVNSGSGAAGWLKGMSVPFMRRGRIWALGDASGTEVRSGPINVWHSSTGANPQGVFTFNAVSATVGGEIDIAPSCIVWDPDLLGGSVTDPFGTNFKIYPVEINL